MNKEIEEIDTVHCSSTHKLILLYAGAYSIRARIQFNRMRASFCMCELISLNCGGRDSIT